MDRRRLLVAVAGLRQEVRKLDLGAKRQSEKRIHWQRPTTLPLTALPRAEFNQPGQLMNDGSHIFIDPNLPICSPKKKSSTNLFINMNGRQISVQDYTGSLRHYEFRKIEGQRRVRMSSTIREAVREMNDDKAIERAMQEPDEFTVPRSQPKPGKKGKRLKYFFASDRVLSGGGTGASV